MSSQGSIRICHSDPTLVAEISFWAKSAGYELVAADSRADLLRDGSDNVSATILELTGSSDMEVDVIEALTKKGRARVMAITQLDTKTVASLRRLFQAKSVDVILQARADFNTRQLAELLKPRECGQRVLDREGLAQAIARGHVVVHYQPKVPFRAGETNFGVEALCRIQHPDMGMIYPDNFIPLAEAHDLILELTDAVTVQAFRDLRAWDEAGRALRMAINISPRLMGSMTWFELFEHRCHEHRIDPKRITLEVTESSSQGGKVLALEILSRLRLKGFLLSIDDFGTGFSSLETLYKLPFGELKIDKGFVFDLLKNNEARTLVESTVSLARKLGLKIVAEGVETDELFQELRSLHCDDAQGYYISKPIAADAIVPFFARWESDSFARANSPANRLKAVHGMLAEILSGSGDDEDATVVLTAAPVTSGGENSRDIAARLPALVMGGDMVGSLAMVHKAVQADGDSDFRGKLLALQCELERSLLESSLVLSDGHQSVQLLGGESFTIGRDSPSAPADVTIPCRWLSRGAKNLKLYREEGRWMVADLGSTNGHFMNGARLKPNEGVPLAEGETVLEVGKTASGPAPAWLRLQVERSGAVHLSFGMANNEEETACATMKWLLLSQDTGPSRSADATVMSDNGDFSSIAWRNGGLWLVPRAGASIQLAGHEFVQSLPLPAGYEVRLGASQWRAEKMRPVLSRPAPPASSTAFA
jgi:EAL domain-containing protein (putative c-di-GMP-specific phosphodiesterase class I)